MRRRTRPIDALPARTSIHEAIEAFGISTAASHDLVDAKGDAQAKPSRKKIRRSSP